MLRLVAHLALPVFGAMALITPLAHTACSHPTPPAALPDGATASRDEMMASKAAISKFNRDVASYNACLDAELQAQLAGTSMTDDQQKNLQSMTTAAQDAAIDELTAVVAEFSKQFEDYKANLAARKQNPATPDPDTTVAPGPKPAKNSSTPSASSFTVAPDAPPYPARNPATYQTPDVAPTTEPKVVAYGTMRTRSFLNKKIHLPGSSKLVFQGSCQGCTEFSIELYNEERNYRYEFSDYGTDPVFETSTGAPSTATLVLHMAECSRAQCPFRVTMEPK
jgi:hypothetical protein